MRLLQLKVTKLFGRFDYHIPFNKNDQITILTGPNGYGKTAILNTIDAMFNGDFEYLFRLQFEKIELSFNNIILKLDKSKSEQLSVEFLSSKTQEPIENHEKFTLLLNQEYEQNRLNRIEEIIPNLRRVKPTIWRDRDLGKYFTLNELLDRYPLLSTNIGLSSYKSSSWFIELIDTTEVHFIKDQRLFTNSNLTAKRTSKSRATLKTLNTIELHAKELRDVLFRCEDEFEDKTTEFDASLPIRLLNNDSNASILSIEKLQTEIERLKAFYKRLSVFNILSDIAPFDFDSNNIPEENRKFLSIYVSDHSEKLKTYEPIIKQIELFTEILSDKNLAFKHVEINPEDGFKLLTDANKEVELYQLSSGEQHLIILFYELIFKAQKNDLLLIDEPEISLHIAWQVTFLKDIKRIIENQDISVIVATHSPQIVDIHDDWAFDLEDD